MRSSQTRHWAEWLVVAAALAIGLSGCVTMRDPESSLEYNAERVGQVSLGQTVGQTFVSRRPRLNRVEVWLRRSADADAEAILTIQLFHSPQDMRPLATRQVRYGAIDQAYPLTIEFSPQDDPPGQMYYLRLLSTGPGVYAYGRAEDAYPEGSLYINGNPVEADLGFRLGYEYEFKAMLSDLGVALRYAWLVIPLLLTLWLPGQMLLSLLDVDRGRTLEKRLDLGETFSMAVGVSLAIIPVAMLWTSQLDWTWTQAKILGILPVAAGAWLWWSYRRRQRQLPDSRPILVDRYTLALLLILICTLGVRLAMVRDLAAPAWVDPIHHATLTRLILEQGQFPDNYQPYVATETARYHPGYHVGLALFVWLSGLDMRTAMLVFGQALNALSVVAVYHLATTLTRNRISGLAAALITGFLTPMPAYYVSWGRYTQLAGLLMAPACLALFFRVMEKLRSPRLFVVSGIAFAGLFLVHYRVVFFLALLMIAYAIAEIIRSLDKQPLWQPASRLAFAAGGIAIIAVISTLPWWPDFLRGMIAPTLRSTSTIRTISGINWGLLTPVYGKVALALAGLGLAWSILRARWHGLILVLWTVLLYISSNPGALGLLGNGFVNQTSIEILLFMPIAVLGGDFIGSTSQALSARMPKKLSASLYILLAAMGTLAALLGTRAMLPILNPVTILYRQADTAAIEWAAKNLPQNETVLINTFLWGYGFYAGQDGGYWLTPLGGQNTFPPPLLYPLGHRRMVKWINNGAKRMLEVSKDPQMLFDFMQERKIRYIYLGGRGGILSPKMLRQSPLFQVIYQDSGVWIIEAVEQPLK